MQRSFFITAFLLATWTGFGQANEFTLQPNGFIYSESTMDGLRHIVDSLNLKYRQCESEPIFYSESQTIGYKITLKTGDIKAAKKALENQINWEDFLKQFPESIVEENVLVIKYPYIDYEKKEWIRFEEIPIANNYGLTIKASDMSLLDEKLEGYWMFDYNSPSSYGGESLKAFYFPDGFQTSQLPEPYASMVAYSDCLVDTTAAKMLEENASERKELPPNWRELSRDQQEELLKTLRSTRVIGFCSMDQGPRKHAIQIAMLSAETFAWEVFLKAHLDIMNDRFDRLSDNSLAQKHRKTYIAELEALNINLLDLMFGICFQISNPAQNHYQGSIRRIGRALAETEQKEELERLFVQVISDESLDPLNRIVFYFLFTHYQYNLEDESRQQKLQQQLAQCRNSFPEPLAKKLNQAAD